MGIELPPELADVAAKAGVKWPQADEEAMARSAQAWRDAATGMSTLATDADTTARSTLSTVSGPAADAASKEWKKFVEPDSGHLTSVVRGCRDAADRLEHAASQVGQAKVEIVRNLVALAQNTDAANAAAVSGHPFALASLDTAVQGTAVNVAQIESRLVSAVQPGSGADMGGYQDTVNANPGAHLLPGVLTAAGELPVTVADTAQGVTSSAGGVPQQTAEFAGAATSPPGGHNLVSDTVHGATGLVADTAQGAGDLVSDVGGAVSDPSDGPGDLVSGVGHGASNLVGDTVHDAAGFTGDVLPAQPDPEITGPVPIDTMPTPPAGQTYQAGFAGGLEASAAPANLPPAAAPVAGAPPPAYGGAPNFGGAPAFGAPAFGAAPGAPSPVPGAPAPAPVGVPAQRPAAAAAPGFVAANPDRPAPDQSAPRKQMAGPPGAPPPLRGEKDQVLAAFWIHMFPIGHLPVASYRPARQLPPPQKEMDYAAGLRFEPGDHPKFPLVDGAARLAEVRAAIAERAAEVARASQTPVPYPTDPPTAAPDAKTVPNLRPATLGPGLPADAPEVAPLLDGHDPLGGGHERDWDRRYLVRLGSVTAQGISQEGLEYNWPTSEQYPEGGSAPGEAEVLDAGTVIDRFGDPAGRVFAADGTPFAQRSLPPAHKDAGYRRYRVVRPLPVWRAVSAAWFGQPGGGVRYRTTHSAIELVALGYLEELS